MQKARDETKPHWNFENARFIDEKTIKAHRTSSYSQSSTYSTSVSSDGVRTSYLSWHAHTSRWLILALGGLAYPDRLWRNVYFNNILPLQHDEEIELRSGIIYTQLMHVRDVMFNPSDPCWEPISVGKKKVADKVKRSSFWSRRIWKLGQYDRPRTPFTPLSIAELEDVASTHAWRGRIGQSRMEF